MNSHRWKNWKRARFQWQMVQMVYIKFNTGQHMIRVGHAYITYSCREIKLIVPFIFWFIIILYKEYFIENHFNVMVFLVTFPSQKSIYFDSNKNKINSFTEFRHSYSFFNWKVEWNVEKKYKDERKNLNFGEFFLIFVRKWELFWILMNLFNLIFCKFWIEFFLLLISWK